MKKRNPIATDLKTPVFRQRVGKSLKDSEESSDQWNRKGKYKNSFKDEILEFYQVGDKVELSDELRKKLKIKPKNKIEVVVNEPFGPDETIGITVDGKYHLVNEEEIELLYEALALNEWSYADVTSGISIIMSNEETEIYKKSETALYKSSLDERNQEVARKLVSKGILKRHRDDKGIFFKQNLNKNIGRF